MSENERNLQFRAMAERFCRGFHVALIVVVLAIAGSNLLGWLFFLDRSPQLSLMRFNAALALTFGGIALWCLREPSPARLRALTGSLLGWLVALIGGLTALQYFTGVDLHIDELFKPQSGDHAVIFTSQPGRMSLNAALTLLSAGLGLALLDFKISLRNGAEFSLAPALAVLGSLPLLAALVGYAIGLGGFTGILGSTNILLHTAIAEFALCAGIWTARPDRLPMQLLLSPDASGVLLRWLGPAMVALLLGLGWIVRQGERGQLYGPHDTTAVMIFLGLVLLGCLLFAAAAALERTEAQRRLADATAREQEERFRTMADNISQLAWMTDASGAIYWYNERWFEYTGTTLAEMKGWAWQKIHHPEHVDRVREHFKHSVAVGQPWEDTFPIRSASGEWRWFLSRALPRKDADGRIIGWFGTNTDVTEQRAAAEALTVAKDRAEHASNAKDEFLAALSHELRTPLSPVLLAAEELCHHEELSPEVRGQLAMIRRNVRLESRLIDDLLDLTRIAHGRLGMQTVACDLPETLREAIEIVRDEVVARSLHLVEEHRANSSWVVGDRTRLEQVFWNLLRNAVKFTPSGGTITVRTHEDAAKQSWILEVSDTGVGIEAAVLPVLFEKFEQGGRENDHRFGGLGLGLAISRAIIERHGGKIYATSAGPGQGATFRVELGPLVPAPIALPSGAPTIVGNDLPPLHLLVVEDHAPTAIMMARLLRRGGHTILAADSVASGLEVAAANDGAIDLVICDLGLPDGSGHELMTTLRTRHGLRGIAVSGYGMEEDLERSRQAGFEAHLTKPIEYAALREALRQLVLTRSAANGSA